MIWRRARPPFTRSFRQKPRRSKRGCLLFVIALGAILFLAWKPVARLFGGFLVRDEAPVHADAAIVLGGDDFGSRTLTAANLVRQGYVPFAILSGPPILSGHESDLTLAYAVQHGFPATYFQTFPNDANSTRSETADFAAELGRRGIHRVLLVTSNYHTRRAYYLFHRTDPSLEIHTIAAPDRWFSPDSWWATRMGQKTFFLEWTKTIATWLGY